MKFKYLNSYGVSSPFLPRMLCSRTQSILGYGRRRIVAVLKGRTTGLQTLAWKDADPELRTQPVRRSVWLASAPVEQEGSGEETPTRKKESGEAEDRGGGLSSLFDRCKAAAASLRTGLTAWKGASARGEAAGRAGGRRWRGEPLYLMLLPGGCPLRRSSYGRTEER